MKVLSIEDVEGERPMKGAVRKVLVHSNNMMMVYVEGPPGGGLAHSHPHEQMGYILKGSAELTASGETLVVKAGTSYCFEPNEYHEFKIIGDESCIVLDVFRPPREDYLPSK